ncbi:hypothetical protein [Frigidibacter sp. ROC022]|uniref:hypothetical protein n=1 Tax=Frigidibacter sp. ROC022 TaxID=2971796 RepID=UPI00215B2AE3|nr:hypothetical protein [Frigidibacter sp. ROC022]MCR8724738.1 hypothetical protein [Frigidibacter sp. ROC022]
MFKALIAAGLLAGPAWAGPIGPMVSSDLNGDGKVERFSLIDSDGSVDLVIENTGGGVVIAEDVAWMGGIGQQPELDVAANGSVRLTSMNEAIGRNRWHLTLTIAYRRNAYMVAGVTYAWYDTLDLDAGGSCDLNLLTGKGILDVKSGRREVRTSLAPMPVTDWHDDVAMPPPGCD